MINHVVHVRSAKKGLGSTPALRALIKKCIFEALENIDFPCVIEVTLTDNEDIRGINFENRSIDSATDVLSFPMLDWHDGCGAKPSVYDIDPESGAVSLGDIVISVERAKEQAEEYGHSFERECGYLTVHSVLHLLGYDHVDDEARQKLMRMHEEQILKKVGLTR